MNNNPLTVFQSKVNYFYAFNGLFAFWALLACIYYIVNTLNINCSQLQKYFIAWTASYGLEIIVPIVCICAAKQSKNYTFAYICLVLAFVYKIGVIGSLLIGAWKHVGKCYIPDTYKVIIAITNALEALCLLVDYVLLYRIKSVNRSILIEKLMTSKTFAEN